MDEEEPWCPRCGVHRDTPYHQYWECEAYPDEVVQVLEKTNYLRPRAEAGRERWPCFWMRGLVPLSWTEGALRPLEPEEVCCSWGIPAEGRLVLPEGAIAGTDGSGGAWGKDPRLRRTAWAFIVTTAKCVPVAHSRGPTKGKQSVVRAELTAICNLVRSTQGSLTVFVDAQYVTKGFADGPLKPHACHTDLWSLLWGDLLHRQGQVKVVKVPSHTRPHDLVGGMITVEQFVLNEWADQLAEKAAEENQFHDLVALLVSEVDKLAWAVQERLAAIVGHVAATKSERVGQGEFYKLRAKGRKRKRQEALAQMVANSEHLVAMPAARAVCSVCSKASSWVRASAWLVKPCIPPEVKLDFHPSHQMQAINSVHYCRLCGSWATQRLRQLCKVCPGHATSGGKKVLRALSKGRPPPGSRAW